MPTSLYKAMILVWVKIKANRKLKIVSNKKRQWNK